MMSVEQVAGKVELVAARIRNRANISPAAIREMLHGDAVMLEVVATVARMDNQAALRGAMGELNTDAREALPCEVWAALWQLAGLPGTGLVA